MNVRNQNIIMLPGKTVDGRDVSEDGKILDSASVTRNPNSLVLRDQNGYSDVIVSRANVLNYPRKIIFTGNITGSFVFDGSEDVTVELNSTPTEIFYTKTQVDDLLKTHKQSQAILTYGDGIVPFEYDGTENITVRTAFAGIQDDFGVENKYVARSDHKHDKRYYTKEEIDSGTSFNFKLRIAGNKIQLLNKDVLLTECLMPSLI